MKKLILIPILLLTIGFQSCNKDRLDVEPVGEFLSSNFFVTEDQVFSGLIAAYDPLAWSMAYGQWISYVMYGEIRSDNANAGGDPSNMDQPGWQEFDDFTNTDANTVTQPIYRRNYIGIFRANTVLEQSQIESATVDRYKAEAKFLRAYYHFELFRHFGPTPIADRLLAPDETGLERSTMSEIFTLITTDLQEAADVLPSTVSSNETGRATKGAALALLGKAYLYWADLSNDDAAKFGQAATAFQQVVDLGIYELEDDYQSLFGFNAGNNSESVFEIQHNPLYTSDWSWFEGIDGNGVIQLCGIRGLCEDHPDYQPGWGFMLPTESLSNHYLADDQYRRDVAITDEAELADELQAAGVNCSPVIDVTQNNPIDATGFWQEKFANWRAYEGTNENGGDPNLTKAANTSVVRYGDLLLMLAESIHRSGGSDGTAMDYIDMVRERAAGPGDNSGTYKNSATIMAEQGWSLQDLIWYERRAELAIEGDRWYDLVRSGRANASLFTGDGNKEANFSDTHLWLPISLEETTVAPMLTTFPDASLFQ